MKKYMIIALCMMNSLNGMEQQNITNQQPTSKIQACYKYDKILTTTFLHFLHRNNINTEGRTILNVECSTGVLSAKLAEKATHVHGFDTNKNVINFACNKYNHIKNLSFEHCRAKNLTTPRVFQLAVIDYSVFNAYTDTIKNKKRLFQCINDNLTADGEFFTTLITSNNTVHPRVFTTLEMIQDIMPDLEEDIINLITPRLSSLEELNTMLQETGFEIIKHEEQSVHLKMTEQQLRDFYRSTITQNQLFEPIPDESKADIAEQYMKSYLSHLDKTDDGKLLEPVITTIIHARKVKK